MRDEQGASPDNTAVRVALWRALHVEIDSPPRVFVDDVGVRLFAPDAGWHSRPDMSPFTRPFRASIVARARFVEDLVAERVTRGVGQYVILGAGLDTFAQRRIERAAAGARASGTPFISFFTAAEMLALGRDAGFREVRHVAAASLAQRYFADRTDGLRPPNNSEELLVAET